MVGAPGHPTSLRYVGQSAHLPAIKILHRDRFLASRQLVPRHCACALNQICNRGQIRCSDQNCTAITPARNKICTWTAKSAPYPYYPPKLQRRWALHRDSFLAKVPGPCPVLASGNTTSPYCRAVSSQRKRLKRWISGMSKQVFI